MTIPNNAEFVLEEKRRGYFGHAKRDGGSREPVSIGEHGQPERFR